ncbi:MAG: response regulator transcription factor [Paludibacteraceae bacterium]|nr:response regulator transcription factor [Paludibacteraceae bacterium]MBR5972893.1 response regulator transcription factor [Paludibacteraceae bacterium]
MENEMVRVIIIDDEFPARKLLSEYVSKLPNLQLCGVCEDAVHAMDVLQKEEVDLILTDIQMPELSGLEFIKSLKKKPMVIFTTAYKEYALDSYELEAIDYLLKPIPFPRFLQAINKVTERLRLKRQAAPAEKEKEYFMVKADYKLYRVDYANLIYVEGQSEYVTFHLKDKKRITAYYSLKRLEEELPSNEFVRIHKSYIVSLSYIESVEGNMVSIAGQKLSIGKNYKDSLMEKLK